MEIKNDIIYANVLYPNDVKEVYQKAKDNFLKGYSASSSDGRHFKWNFRLSKAEVVSDEVVYFDESKKEEKVVDAIITTTIQEKPKALSDNVSLVKNKINSYKTQIEALSSTVAGLTSEVAKKDDEIKSLKLANDELKSKIKSLESDIQEIANL